jgi:cobalamin biosynthesis protein CbiD
LLTASLTTFACAAAAAAAAQVYQDLCKKHTTFRERSENVDLAVSASAVLVD